MCSDRASLWLEVRALVKENRTCPATLDVAPTRIKSIS